MKSHYLISSPVVKQANAETISACEDQFPISETVENSYPNVDESSVKKVFHGRSQEGGLVLPKIEVVPPKIFINITCTFQNRNKKIYFHSLALDLMSNFSRISLAILVLEYSPLSQGYSSYCHECFFFDSRQFVFQLSGFAADRIKTECTIVLQNNPGI